MILQDRAVIAAYCGLRDASQMRSRRAYFALCIGHALSLLFERRHTGQRFPTGGRWQCCAAASPLPRCGARFTTFERVQLRDLQVLKSSGKRAPFDRDKLIRSVRIALQKRPIEEDRIEQMVSGIVRQLESSGQADVTSKQIGELVMEGLAELDKIGYVRYASVYRDFRATEDFGQFIESEKLSENIIVMGDHYRCRSPEGCDTHDWL